MRVEECKCDKPTPRLVLKPGDLVKYDGGTVFYGIVTSETVESGGYKILFFEDYKVSYYSSLYWAVQEYITIVDCIKLKKD